MLAVSKEKQIKLITKLLREKGVDPQTVDLEALVDSNLTVYENIRNIEKQTGIKLLSSRRSDGYGEDEIRKMEEEGNNAVLEKHLNELGIEEVLEEELKEESEKFREKLEYKFEEIAERGIALNVLSKFLFPEIVGDQYDEIRKAVLLSLITHYDRKRRTRIHVLIIGPPGTGKTEILKWLHTKLGAAFVNGEYVSKVGLTADARGRMVTPGLLAEHDGNVVCIDELDKISAKDQGGLLQAMEEGYYTVVKGKHRAKFRAEVRIIASANDKNKIQKPLLDRFDFVFELRNPDKEERKRNVEKLVEQFFGISEVPNIQILYNYLQWIYNYEPQVEDLEKIKEVMKSYIELTNVNFEEYSYRSLELSILRIAYALAKLNKQTVNPETVVKAIRLKDKTLTPTQYKYLMAVAKNII